MNARETAAYTAGIETARQMALTVATSLEVREDAPELRQQAAIAALQGFAEGLQALVLEQRECLTHCSPVDLNNGAEAGDSREAGHE